MSATPDACRRWSLQAGYLKNSWMKPHSTMAHSAENRKGPMNLHIIAHVSCCQSIAPALMLYVPCTSSVSAVHVPRLMLEALDSREVFAFPCSVEAVCCQAANDCCCQNHCFQHNLRREDRARGAHADAEAECLQCRHDHIRMCRWQAYEHGIARA